MSSNENGKQMLEAAVAAVQAGQVTCQAIVMTAAGPAYCGKPATAIWNVTLAGEAAEPIVQVSDPQVPSRQVALAAPLCKSCDINPEKFAIGVNRIPLGDLVAASGAPMFRKKKGDR